ncbi:MAG: hypothetical protein V7696_11215 [Halioglobus sp.]
MFGLTKPKKKKKIPGMELSGIIEALHEIGKIKPVIDGLYKLSEVPELLQYFADFEVSFGAALGI